MIVLLSGFCNVYAQNAVIIRGHVTDSVTNESLSYVNVAEVDKNGRFVSAKITDENGNYVLQVTNPQNPVQVSFIGYRKQTFKINGRSQIDIKLVSESLNIAEVTVEATKIANDGYTKVRDRATSVQRLDTKDMKSIMSTSVEDMLQGRLGGVDISSVSGDPGAGLSIRIRGTASLSAKNNPLIVINGIPYDAAIDPNFDFASADVEKFGNLIDVSPEDIETIEVLKDAASTAPWGSRASNGVLMIKTKRGSKSKPVFEYTYKNTISKEPKSIPMLDGAGYARLITEEYYNVNRGVFSSTANYRQIAYDPTWIEYYNYSQNTNWVKEITQLGTTQQHDFSVRGGGEKSKYNMSVGYSDEVGTTINNELKKLNLRTSLDYDLSTKLQFRSDIMFTRYDQNSNFNGDIRSIAYRKMPNLSVYDRDSDNVASADFFTPLNTLQGTASSVYNPVAAATLGINKQYRDNARALFSIRYNVMKGVIFNSTVTLDIFDSKTSKFQPFKAIGYEYNSTTTNQASDGFSKKSTIYTINQLIYNPDLGNSKHELGFMGQFDTQESIDRALNITTSQSASQYLQLPVGDKHINSLSAGYSKYRSMGMYVTANYKFDDKYIVSLGAKYEGNSNYARESRWGLFPTVSVAWRINKENFLKDVYWMNDFKIRSSWGQTGNSTNGASDSYATYSAGSNLSYIDMKGVVPNGVEQTNLKWEILDQLNPGISFMGLDNKLNVEIDYYWKRTLDMSLSSNVPSSSGFSSFKQNKGEMLNQGFEFLADYTILKTKDWQLSFNMNFSHNKNTVISLPENYLLVYGDMLANGNYKISVTPGEALGGFFGYRYLGVYTSDADAIVRDKDGEPVFGLNKNAPMRMIMGGTSGYEFEGGDAKYDDINHDGKIDELDLVYLGDLNPKVMGGLGNRIQYKSFIVNYFLYFKIGQKIINQTRMDTEKMFGYDNQSKATNWRWRREGDITDMPRALYNKGYNWLGSDRFVEDGSYLRLKTVSLSYIFDKSVCKLLKVKDLKVYGTAYNLFTITNYSGQDPDVSQPSSPSSLPKDSSKTPPGKRVMLGINVTF